MSEQPGYDVIDHNQIQRNQALRDEIERLRALNATQRKMLETIARMAAPGTRTFDQMLHDMNAICDLARARLAGSETV